MADTDSTDQEREATRYGSDQLEQASLASPPAFIGDAKGKLTQEHALFVHMLMALNTFWLLSDLQTLLHKSTLTSFLVANVRSHTGPGHSVTSSCLLWETLAWYTFCNEFHR